MSSYGASSDEIQAAVWYMAGICAPFGNAGVVGVIPSTITLAPTPGASGAATVPQTTVTISTVVTVPATFSAGPSAGQQIPSSSVLSTVNTVVTVPQVAFTTATAAGPGATPSAGLAAGAPAPAPAGPLTSAAAAVTTLGTVGVGSSSAAPAATSPITFAGAASGLVVPGAAGFGAMLLAALAL